jgi:hypothetical protein
MAAWFAAWLGLPPLSLSLSLSLSLFRSRTAPFSDLWRAAALQGSGTKELYAAVGVALSKQGCVAVLPDYVKHPVAQMPTIEQEIVECTVRFFRRKCTHSRSAIQFHAFAPGEALAGV